MMTRKDKVVADSTNGISYLFDKNKIKIHPGLGKIVSKNEIEVTQDKKSETITAKYIMIATGSLPRQLPSLPFDGKKIIFFNRGSDFIKNS